MNRFRAGVLGAAMCLGLGIALGGGARGAARTRQTVEDRGPRISAVFADGFAAGNADEAVQIWNSADQAVEIGGWMLDDGEGQAAFPPGTRIAARGRIWASPKPEAFARSFGHAPDAAWSMDPGWREGIRMSTVGEGPKLADGGERLRLVDARGRLVDLVAYGAGGDGPDEPGWRGAAVQAYAGGVIGARHQVLYRKLDPRSGEPIRDRDRAEDWASDANDPVLGRRARYPGWDLETALRPRRLREQATVALALAPDALRDFLLAHFQSARRSIDLAVYSFENPVLAEALAERAASGVRLRLLVEGRPVGGIDMAQRWCLARIAEAGGQVWWMDGGGDVPARYRGMHAKLGLIDERTVLIGSENPNLGSTPGDDLQDGTAGRRGVYAAITAPGAAAWARSVLDRDIDPDAHVDLRPFQARDPERGAPPADYRPERLGGGAGYSPIAAPGLRLTEPLSMEWLTAPEGAMDPDLGPVALVGRAGPGDRVLVQQLSEPLWWGDGPSEGDRALSPRVQAYLAAARRGAQVRVLLDGYFDDPTRWNGNHVTVAHLSERAASEGLDLEARLGNPTGKGLHNKMILVSSGCGDARSTAGRRPLGCARWSHLGSLNGSEVASKVNREAAVNLGSDAIFGYLAGVFAWDWARSGAHALFLPWAGLP